MSAQLRNLDFVPGTLKNKERFYSREYVAIIGIGCAGCYVG